MPMTDQQLEEFWKGGLMREVIAARKEQQRHDDDAALAILFSGGGESTCKHNTRVFTLNPLANCQGADRPAYSATAKLRWQHY